MQTHFLNSLQAGHRGKMRELSQRRHLAGEEARFHDKSRLHSCIGPTAYKIGGKEKYDKRSYTPRDVSMMITRILFNNV